MQPPAFLFTSHFATPDGVAAWLATPIMPRWGISLRDFLHHLREMIFPSYLFPFPSYSPTTTRGGVIFIFSLISCYLLAMRKNIFE